MIQKRILFLNCFGPLHPTGGGAEIYGAEFMSRLVKEGHKVTWISAKFPSASHRDEYKGIEIIRWGNRLSVILYAFLYYLRNRKCIDVVIDNFHAYPYLTCFFVPKKKRLIVVYEIIGKEIWSKVFRRPISDFGIWFERILLKYFYNNDPFITISNSSKQELESLGIKNIKIVQCGIKKLDASLRGKRKKRLQLIHFTAFRPVKQLDHLIEVVKILKRKYPNIKLLITGRKQGSLYESLVKMRDSLGLQENVEFVGFLDQKDLEQKIAQSYLTLGASVKEGWGMMVTEAGFLGTPAVCYNSQGYRDIINGNNGVLTKKNTPKAMAKEIVALLENKYRYKKIRDNMISYAETQDWEARFDEFYTCLLERVINANGKVSLAKKAQQATSSN